MTFKAVDCAGNVEGSHTLTIKLDKNNPSLTCPASQTAEATSADGAVVNYPAATASDAASTPVVTYSKASGTVFPLGATTVVVTAKDAAGNTATCSFDVKVGGPRSIKENVRSELSALRALVSDKQDGKKLDQAIGDLTRALGSSLWVDETHLDTEKGERVFADAKEAVAKLEDLLKNKEDSALSDVVLQGLIDRIVRADRLLAQTAIADASAAGGDAKSIAQAREKLASGDADAAGGKYASAIADYRNAWHHAINSHQDQTSERDRSGVSLLAFRHRIPKGTG